MISWQARALEIYLRVNKVLSGNSGELDVTKERAEVESMAGMFKPIGEIKCEPVMANGIPAEWIIPREERPGGAILFIHGGSFNSGSIPSHRTLAGNVALASRARALLIDYRLAPHSIWPAQRDDMLAALTYLQAHSAQLGLDPTRFVLFGRSAGGNLAEALACTAHDPAVRGVIALYAPADLQFAWDYAREDDMLKSPQLLRQFLGGPPAAAPAAYASSSGYRHVTPTSPPTLLVHGRLDTLVWHRQSERLAARLADARVPHVFVSLPWATHAFEFNLHGPGGQLTTFSVEWFLAAVTR